MSKLKSFIYLIKNLFISVFCFGKLKMNLFCKLKGKISIKIDKSSKVNIGKNVCVDGPIYIKSIRKSSINIGDNCYFNHNCFIASLSNIKIGNDCMFGNNVVIVDHNHDVVNGIIKGSEFTKKSILINDNAWIGANSVILQGVTIGKGSIVAAGAVVTCDIPDFEIWGGVPAKKIKSLKK